MTVYYTPTYALAYPGSDTALVSLADVGQQVAFQLESVLGNRSIAPADISTYVAAGFFADTGWVNLTVSAGFAVNGTETPQVRNRAGVLYFRGSVSNTGMTASGVFNVLTIPSGMRSTALQNNIGGVGLASSSGDATATGTITAAGVIGIRTSSTLGSFYRLDAFSGVLAA